MTVKCGGHRQFLLGHRKECRARGLNMVEEACGSSCACSLLTVLFSQWDGELVISWREDELEVWREENDSCYSSGDLENKLTLARWLGSAMSWLRYWCHELFLNSRVQFESDQILLFCPRLSQFWESLMSQEAPQSRAKWMTGHHVEVILVINLKSFLLRCEGSRHPIFTSVSVGGQRSWWHFLWRNPHVKSFSPTVLSVMLSV